MEKKYKFVDEVVTYHGAVLHRIQALRDFGKVKKGDLGGWIEKESNLSHEGTCWVYDNAKVFGGAVVSGSASIRDEAKVYGRAIVSDASVFGKAKVYGNATVFGKAKVFGSAVVYDNVFVRGNARVFGSAEVYGLSSVKDSACVYGEAKVFGHSCVFGNARVHGSCLVREKAIVCGQAEISGAVDVRKDAVVSDRAKIFGTAILSSASDYIVFRRWWSDDSVLTWTRSNNEWSVDGKILKVEDFIRLGFDQSKQIGMHHWLLAYSVNCLIMENL